MTRKLQTLAGSAVIVAMDSIIDFSRRPKRAASVYSGIDPDAMCDSVARVFIPGL